MALPLIYSVFFNSDIEVYALCCPLTGECSLTISGRSVLPVLERTQKN